MVKGKKKTGPGRKRRSPEERIADLRKQIAKIEARAVAREVVRSDAVKATVKALRAIDKGAQAAEREGNAALRRALADARDPLALHLSALGVKPPVMRRPKGPRPK